MIFDLRDLCRMFDEIRAVNIDKGWHPHDLELGEVFALLHTEVAEMTDAYRQWGLEDGTTYERTLYRRGDHGEDLHIVVDNPKPEGVGSEMADVLIRLLDNYEMLHTNLAHLNAGAGRFGYSDRFGTACNTLHTLIARLSMAVDSYECCPIPEELPFIGRMFRDVYQYLIQMAEHFGINLKAEYERKLAFNKTRAYRHGGKKM